MRKVFGVFVTIAIVLGGCQKNINDQSLSSSVRQDQKISARQINDFIMQRVQQNGSFECKEASDEMVWSASQYRDKIISVGYKPASEALDISQMISTININDPQWKEAKQQVLQLIFNEERLKNPQLKMEDLEVWKEKKLPVVDVKIESLKTIRLLRKSPFVRYAEPMGYDPIENEDNEGVSGFSIFNGSGCGDYSGNNTLIPGVDYTVITPDAKASWHYNYHGIQNAWTKTSGAGVKLMVIDTGVDPDQDNLGTDFNQGLSSGRTLEKIFTLPNASDANDRCGHGTTMCGEAAAPRCTDGNSCGVAYNSDLVVCRASKDVYIDESAEVKGVSDAYTWAGDNTSVKITSMSMGRITGSGQIKDAIDYAYGKGKLMFCAGGTSFAWANNFVGVIFPASLPNVMAITGVTDDQTLKECSDCHKGKQIDFVIVMEKSSNKLTALSTATSGDVPTTVGGSSVATSTAAAIAALVWSRFPAYSRQDVVNKLTVTASSYPNKTANFGWGKLNADAATN